MKWKDNCHDEIIVRRCPNCAQPYDVKYTSYSGACIQPEKCCRCGYDLPILGKEICNQQNEKRFVLVTRFES